jgi:hypothetical protein
VNPGSGQSAGSGGGNSGSGHGTGGDAGLLLCGCTPGWGTAGRSKGWDTY